MKKRVVVSACLLGHTCRYDGKTKKTTEVIDALSEYEILPFCPEAPLFGTPRERISVVDVEGEHRIITDETNRDVTQLLHDEIMHFIEQNPQFEKIVLKSKSPSCGVGTTPILNSKREKIGEGNGIAGDIFLEKFSHLKIEDERIFS
jgi:uncharacterized protein YbbK (DUF523 family)